MQELKYFYYEAVILLSVLIALFLFIGWNKPQALEAAVEIEHATALPAKLDSLTLPVRPSGRQTGVKFAVSVRFG